MKRIPFLILISCFPFFSCEKALDLKDPGEDRSAVFEDLWNYMDKHYPLFVMKGVDWTRLHDEYRSKISNDMTEDTYFRLLRDILESVRDGHVALMSKNDTAVYDGFYKPYPVNFNYQNIVNRYLLNSYVTKGPVIYKIVDSVGYLYYPSFEKEISGPDLQDLVNEFNQKTKALIIDVRNNGGGNSANADKLFSYFITAETVVKFEVKKNGPGHEDYSQPQPIRISAATVAYKKPIAVLTNRTCYSACNDFVLYMSGLPNAKIVGDKTGGGGGIPRDYILSNGWKLQYTSTVTLSPEKLPIEDGIQPDISVSISSLDETNGVDPILERAFQLLH